MQYNQAKEVGEKPQRSKGSASFRADRTYVSVVMEDGQIKGRGQAELNPERKGNSEHKLVFTSETTKATLKWLNISALGKLNSFIPPKSVQESLAREGIVVDVSTYGGLSVIVTFTDRELMEVLLKDYESIFGCWFQSIEPWDLMKVERDSFWWLSITGIPLQLWHHEFFKQFGALWGSYLSTDSTTKMRYRLDQARILVASAEQRPIPAEVKVMVEGQEFILEIRVEPGYDFMAIFTDRKLPDWVVERAFPYSKADSSQSRACFSEGDDQNSNNFEYAASGSGADDGLNDRLLNLNAGGQQIEVSRDIPNSNVGHGRNNDPIEEPMLKPSRIRPITRKSLEENELRGGEEVGALSDQEIGENFRPDNNGLTIAQSPLEPDNNLNSLTQRPNIVSSSSKVPETNPSPKRLLP